MDKQELYDKMAFRDGGKILEVPCGCVIEKSPYEAAAGRFARYCDLAQEIRRGFHAAGIGHLAMIQVLKHVSIELLEEEDCNENQ